MLTEVIEKALEKENISLNEFRELIIRLLNFTVLCRDESQIEQQLYDRYLRINLLVKEYLSLMDIRVFHDNRFDYIRLYPPSSQVPGMEEAGDQAFSGSLRARLSQSEVSLILVLRLQYDKALREAQVDDKGFVTESFEAINIAMKNIMGRSLPDKPGERQKLFKRCKKLRLIEYRNEEDVLKVESWLKIHPMIVSFVNDEAIQALENTPVENIPVENTSAEAAASEDSTESPLEEMSIEEIPEQPEEMD